jgi:hypothetical protein
MWLGTSDDRPSPNGSRRQLAGLVYLNFPTTPPHELPGAEPGILTPYQRPKTYPLQFFCIRPYQIAVILPCFLLLRKTLSIVARRREAGVTSRTWQSLYAKNRSLLVTLIRASDHPDPR